MVLNYCVDRPDHDDPPIEPHSDNRQHVQEARAFVLRLRPGLPLEDVTRLIGYVCDFGAGSVRGHALGKGWCLRLDNRADVELLRRQWPELVEGHAIDDVDVLWRSM